MPPAAYTRNAVRLFRRAGQGCYLLICFRGPWGGGPVGQFRFLNCLAASPSLPHPCREGRAYRQWRASATARYMGRGEHSLRNGFNLEAWLPQDRATRARKRRNLVNSRNGQGGVPAVGSCTWPDDSQIMIAATNAEPMACLGPKAAPNMPLRLGTRIYPY